MMGGQQKYQKNINYTLIKNNLFKKSEEILEDKVMFYRTGKTQELWKIREKSELEDESRRDITWLGIWGRNKRDYWKEKNLKEIIWGHFPEWNGGPIKSPVRWKKKILCWDNTVKFQNTRDK